MFLALVLTLFMQWTSTYGYRIANESVAISSLEKWHQFLELIFDFLDFEQILKKEDN